MGTRGRVSPRRHFRSLADVAATVGQCSRVILHDVTHDAAAVVFVYCFRGIFFSVWSATPSHERHTYTPEIFTLHVYPLARPMASRIFFLIIIDARHRSTPKTKNVNKSAKFYNTAQVRPYNIYLHISFKHYVVKRY